MSSSNIYFLQNGSLSSKDELLLDTGKPVFVMVQADWCGHCKTAKPIFQQFADMASDSITFATVNAGSDSNDSEKALVKRLGVRGFPSFLLYVGGKKVEISIQQRTVDGFKKALAAVGVKV